MTGFQINPLAINRSDRKSNIEKVKQIEALLIGAGAELFRDIEHSISQFCPFEAIGMVRQEIRHAHFLCFLLDPNRPHPFKDRLLKIFFQEILKQAQEGQLRIQPLTVHCADLNQALVYRERANIDLMIEVPPTTGSKGIILTVELKIDAVESKGQLSKYRHHIEREYPTKNWDHIFVFLTLHGTDPSKENIKHWIPVGLVGVMDQFDQEISARKYYGGAIELYKNYSSMIRRHLVKDEKIAQLAKNIWAQHKEALEVLYDYKPDLQAEIIGWVTENSEDLFSMVEDKTGFTLSQDTSSSRLLRYSINDWQSLPEFCTGDEKWVATRSILVLELTDWKNGRLRFSFVLGPGPVGIRSQIYDLVLRDVDSGKIGIGRKTKAIGTWKHFSGTDVQSAETYAKGQDHGANIEEMGKGIFDKMTKFLEEHLPVYDDILKEVLNEKNG